MQSGVWSKCVPELLYEGDPAGDPGLRQAIATVVAPTRGLSVDAGKIVVVGSTMDGFDLISAVLPRKSTVIVES